MPITVWHDRAGDAERGELCGAEMADDRGVGEQEDRLGDQGGERGDGEPGDLAVLRPARDAEPPDQGSSHLVGAEPWSVPIVRLRVSFLHIRVSTSCPGQQAESAVAFWDYPPTLSPGCAHAFPGFPQIFHRGL